jgi:mono/diheme cytochrome c family protein
LLTLPVAAQQAPPPWAYPVLAPGVKPPPDDGLEKTVPGSKTSFTRKQISDLFNAHDWFPEDHPPMPDVVAHGRGPEVRPCGMCHLPNGQGRPENAPLAGLSATYIAQQIADFQSGGRRSAVPTTRPQTYMVETAKHASDEDVKVAAAYFSKLTYRPWIRVIEAGTVPKTEVIFGTLWAPAPGTETEALGHRIVEIPENLERTELERIRRLRPGRQSRARRKTGDHRGRRQDYSLRGVSWPGPERPRRGPPDRGTFHQLYRPADLRHSIWRPSGLGFPAHAAGRCETDDGRHDLHSCLGRLARSVNSASKDRGSRDRADEGSPIRRLVSADPGGGD